MNCREVNRLPRRLERDADKVALRTSGREWKRRSCLNAWLPSVARQQSHVEKILRTAGGSFVGDQVVSPDDPHPLRAVAGLDTIRPGISEDQSVDLSGDVDAIRGDANLERDSRFCEIGLTHVMKRCPKRLKGGKDP